MIDRRKCAENLVSSASAAIVLMSPRDAGLPMWLAILDDALAICIETRSTALLDVRAAASSLVRAETTRDREIAVDALRLAVRARSQRAAARLQENLVRGY